MMPYRFSEIANILGAAGQIVRPDAEIEHLLTDSRTILFPERSLFFGIGGKNHDGNQFIKQVYDAGVRNFIVEKNPTSKFDDANIVIVDSAIPAMQNIAANHRKKFTIPVIGITGSNGKTIVKEWINHFLKIKFDIARSPKSYNSQLGVPLSVWQMNEQNDLAIFEAGISLPGEMEKLEEIIQPTIGIITNIGEAHAEGFLNDGEKLNEKLKLFRRCKIVIYRKDDVLIDNAIKTLPVNSVSWSIKNNPAADVLIKDIEQLPDETLFTLVIDDKAVHFKIPFTDEASFENAIHAILASLIVSRELDHSDAEAVELITEQAETLPVISMRLELKKGINNSVLINDVYSADLNSLAIALHFLRHQSEGMEHAVILSDFDETGEDDEVLYKKVAALLSANHVNSFYGIGELISENKNAFTAISSSFYSTAEDFIANAQPELFSNRVVLIKGARRFQLERISNLLELKTHGTELKIYLDRLVHNLNSYRSLLKPGVKTMAMVKAFSYGSGQAEIARTLAHNRVDYLAVAYTDEGVELRRQGIKTPILVMNPEPDSFQQLFRYNLEPEIYNFRIFDKFIKSVASTNNLSQGEGSTGIHIKLDTGMHRLGFEEKEIGALIKLIEEHKQITIKSVFTHISSADDDRQNEFTKQQLGSFEKFSSAILHSLGYPVLRHALNSPGISKFPEGQFDMVRLGIGLYGIDPSSSMQNKLKPVSRLTTTISQIKEIQPGDSIGYGRSFIADKNMRIATINIGYADGFSRRMSNGNGKVFIAGKFAPVTGRVCMDMTMVDITHIPRASEGDEVEIFGENISISEYATWQETIPYEIMTGISQRVKRVYVQE